MGERCRHWVLVVISLVGLGRGQAFAAPVDLRSPLTIRRPVEARRVTETVFLSAEVEPLVWDVVRTKWSSTIRRFAKGVGDTVKADEVLAELDLGTVRLYAEIAEGSLRAAQSSMVATRINVEHQREKAEKARSLVEQGYAPASQLDAEETQSIASQIATINAERALRAAEANLREVRERERVANYLSPIDGTIVEMAVDPRQLLGPFNAEPNAVLARIERPDHYVARAQALDTQIVRVAAAKVCRIRLDAASSPRECKIKSVAKYPTMEAAKASPFGGGGGEASAIKTYEVVIAFDSLDRALPTGFRAIVEIDVASVDAKVALSWNSIVVDSGEPYAQVFDPKAGAWARRRLELGLRGKHFVEVLRGVEVGEEVATTAW